MYIAVELHTLLHGCMRTHGGAKCKSVSLFHPSTEGEPCVTVFFLFSIYIYTMIRVFERTGIGQEFFSSRPQYGMIETGISRSNRFVRAPSSRGGSNAPHPVLSVPHLDVNQDEG